MTTRTVQPMTTLPPPPMLPSDIPATPKGARMLRRRFVLPDGSSCTLTLVDEHSGAVGPLTARYRLTHHAKDVRHGKVVFEGSAVREPDPEDTAVNLLRMLTVRPGEAGDERLGSYTPGQLEWCMHYAEPLRLAAAARMGWGDPSDATVHADLSVIAQVRAELKAGARYRMRLGVLDVSARTKREVKAALAAAVSGQCSTTPAVRVGATTQDVYVMYPLGTEYVLQLVHPRRQERPLGVSERYEAPSVEAALGILDATVAKRERGAAVSAQAARRATPAPMPSLPVRRPSARPTRVVVRPSSTPSMAAVR